jgi:hypothetical protein
MLRGEIPVWTSDVDTSWWVAAKASHAAKGHETDPRRLVSEVGPSETGHCVSGAGAPGCNKTITAPRRVRVAEELMKLVNGTVALSISCCRWRGDS